MLYVDQWGRVKQKSDDLSSSWTDVFFNLTKEMIGFLLSDQFRNIEPDSNSYSLENQNLCLYVGSRIHINISFDFPDSNSYSLENQNLCFYVSSLIHWWLCIEFFNMRLWLTLTCELETSFLFRLMCTIWSNLLHLLLIELMLKVSELNCLLFLV